MRSQLLSAYLVQRIALCAAGGQLVGDLVGAAAAARPLPPRARPGRCARPPRRSRPRTAAGSTWPSPCRTAAARRSPRDRRPRRPAACGRRRSSRSCSAMEMSASRPGHQAGAHGRAVHRADDRLVAVDRRCRPGRAPPSRRARALASSVAISSTIARSPPPEKPMPSPRSTAQRTVSSADTSRQISASSRWPSWPAVGSLPFCARIWMSSTASSAPRRVIARVW